jgi:prolyl 4-hydroxylase
MGDKTENNETIENKEPLVLTMEDCLTQEECDHMIRISKPVMKKSLVSYASKGVESAGRTSHNAWIQHGHDEITKSIGEKIAKIVGLPLENAEAFQVIYYDTNAEYRSHYDSWEHNGSEKTLRCMKYGGARLKTALVYLNDVEEGGSTKLNRLDIDVLPKKGKLLLFENTYPGTNIKHPLSEHAGMPVIKGEKYAFNLWFKECHSKKLYAEFNPEYYNNNNIQDNLSVENTIFNVTTTTTPTSTNTEQALYKYTQLTKLKEPFTKVSEKKNIYKVERFLEENECNQIIESCDFTKSKSKYMNCWVGNDKFPDTIHKIEEAIGIQSRFFENMNVFKYGENQIHGPFMEAYDITSENGKKYTEKKGQRVYTITIPLNNNTTTKFNHINETIVSTTGSMLIYDNMLHNSKSSRDKDMEHTLYNTNESETYLLNIYVREKDAENNLPMELITDTVSIDNATIDTAVLDSVVNAPLNTENYKETYDNVLKLFEQDKIHEGWRGLNSFNYVMKGNFDYFKNTVVEYIHSRTPPIIDVIDGDIIDILNENNNSAMNDDNLQKTYVFDEYTPVVVENVLNKNALTICQQYYSTNIEKGAYILGDKQSKRFKSHNEPLSRILHYEILPLIEKIVGKKLMPSYTYLSAYVKDSDLPAHTDRADCEYTVSFLINKPENSKWPIYLHKVKQPVKHKGRSGFTPPKEECIAVDCNAGGLMIFQGTDHIHFREGLPDDFYHIVLLHYVSV